MTDSVLRRDPLARARRGHSRIGELSRRQRDVLGMILEDKSNREIAEALSMAERTVKAHVAALMERLGMESRLQLALVAMLEQLESEIGAARDSSRSGPNYFPVCT